MRFNIPACSISNEIEELLSLCERFDDIGPTKFIKPAKEEDLLAWEQTNGIELPETFKEWLRFCNGAQIDGQLVCLFSLEEIEVGSSYIPEHLVYVGDLIGDGERLCFEKETGRFVSFLSVYREEHLTIYGDFKDFLLETIRFMKSDIGEEECEEQTEPKKEKEMSSGLKAKFLEFIRAQKDTPEGLTKDEELLLAKLEDELGGGE